MSRNNFKELEKKLGEKLLEIELVRKSNINIKPSKYFSKTIYYLVALIAIILASEVLELQTSLELIWSLTSFIPRLIMAFVVLIVGILFSDFLRKIDFTTCDSLGIPSVKIISLVVFYFLLINVAMVALSQAGIDTGFIEQNVSIIISGAVGAFSIGYGLASKGSVENFLSSNNMSNYVELR
jgi:small-conductance mechanosensitive channel